MKRIFLALFFTASLRAQTIYGGGTAAASTATTAAITDDTTTNATVYPVWVTANTGNLPLKVSSTKIAANPSTGALTIGGPLTFGTSASVLSGTTGSIGLSATGTNQTITLTPTGTGSVAISGSGGTLGLLSLPAGAADSTSGMSFGTDTFFFRTGTGLMRVTGGAGPSMDFVSTTNTVGVRLQADGSGARGIIGTTTNHSLQFTSNSSVFLIGDTAQNTSLPGSATTYHGTAAAAANTATQLVKSVTGIANAAATDVLTVTIPNAAHSAHLHVDLVGSLGAGGAIGANEATGAISYDFSIARTAGVATVTTASTAYGSATSSVAGAATITITAAATAMTGAVGATQTFTIQVTISHGTGSSTNHTCQVRAMIQNANATGVTIS